MTTDTFAPDLDRLVAHEEEEAEIEVQLGPDPGMSRNIPRGTPGLMSVWVTLHDLADGTEYKVLRKAAPHYLQKRTDEGQKRYSLAKPLNFKSPEMNVLCSVGTCGKKLADEERLDEHMRAYHGQTYARMKLAEERAERRREQALQQEQIEQNRRLMEQQMEQNRLLQEALGIGKSTRSRAG